MRVRPTAAGLVRAAAERLAAAGIEGAALEARLLLGVATGLDRTALLAFPDRPVPDRAVAAFQALVRRRAGREPLAHVSGSREFWSLPFRVGPGVLVPRPDSETLIEAVLAVFPDRARPLRVLDIGTGSGCLLLAVLHEYGSAEGVGTDTSDAALRWAWVNVEALGLASRARLVRGAFAAGEPGPFDVVLSNPPYVATGDLPGLAPELAFEPREALDGGADGLDAYRTLVPLLPGLLAPDGAAVLEHGSGQADAIAAMASDVGLAARSRPDLAGRPRALVLRRLSADGGA